MSFKNWCRIVEQDGQQIAVHKSYNSYKEMHQLTFLAYDSSSGVEVITSINFVTKELRDERFKNLKTEAIFSVMRSQMEIVEESENEGKL